MTLIKEINNKKAKSKKPLVIGYFGCIHKGHMPLFTDSKKFNIMTFLNLPKKQINQLYFDDERLKNLKLLGANKIYLFDLNDNNMSAIDFINNVLIPLEPTKIIVGKDFRFGKNATGDEKLLSNFFTVTAIPYDERFSTTKIKQLIMDGKIDVANDLLVKKFSISGKQVSGEKIGSKQGWPTINIEYPLNKINLKLGSYVTSCYFGKKAFQAITFVGNRELTSNTYGLIIETHIINALPGEIEKLTKKIDQTIKIEFLKYIRVYTRFASNQLLLDAIKGDSEFAKEFFQKEK